MNQPTKIFLHWLNTIYDDVRDEFVVTARSSSDAVTTLATQLKHFFDEDMPKFDTSSVYLDLLLNALDEVNYRAVAKELLHRPIID